MSVVSGILSRLEYIGRMRWRIPFLESRLGLSFPRVPSVGLGGRDQWFSSSSRNEFNREELARRSINESLGRTPIAR
jgi:hypothetical protein